jgi:hypothetical protein
LLLPQTIVWTFSNSPTNCVRLFTLFITHVTTVLKRTTCANDLCPHPFRIWNPFSFFFFKKCKKEIINFYSRVIRDTVAMDTWDIVIHFTLFSLLNCRSNDLKEFFLSVDFIHFRQQKCAKVFERDNLKPLAPDIYVSIQQ